MGGENINNKSILEIAEEFKRRVLENLQGRVLLMVLLDTPNPEVRTDDEDVRCVLILSGEDGESRRIVFDITSEIYFRKGYWIYAYCLPIQRFGDSTWSSFLRDIIRYGKILWMKGNSMEEILKLPLGVKPE